MGAAVDAARAVEEGLGAVEALWGVVVPEVQAGAEVLWEVVAVVAVEAAGVVALVAEAAEAQRWRSKVAARRKARRQAARCSAASLIMRAVVMGHFIRKRSPALSKALCSEAS